MNAVHQARSLSTSFVGRVAPMLSPEVRQFVALGHERGWRPTVIGRAPVPREPVRLEDWLIAPVHQDSSPVPDRALRRVQDIFAAGLRPKGFVVVHEAPRLLPAPTQQKPKPLRMPVLSDQLRSTLKLAGAGLGVLGAGLVIVTGVAVLAVAALSLAAILVVPATLVVGAVVVDPILVAVTEDGYWIEIDRWWN